ncbi:NUDIX hydrolase [Candidatus Saccharibacteria bacterium]|nr:NUDIX hydrolase [Candidatus Saccharibacteria bacterium]
MAKEKLFHVGVKGLVENEKGEVLVLSVEANRYNKFVQHWDIPGGRIEYGGTIEGTLSREIDEETGIKTIESAKFFTSVISTHEFEIETGQTVGLVLMVYKVKVPEGSIVEISHEHTGYEWVNRKEAAKRLAQKYPPEFTSLL